jgi:hypothetical protein
MLNSGLRKMVKARWTADLRCIKDASRGVLIQTLDECIAERGGHAVRKLEDKLIDAGAKKCAPAPAFGPQGVGELSVAAVDAVGATVSTMFGGTLEGRIAGDPLTSNCQREAATALQSCEDVMLVAFNRCKRDALKGVTAAPVASALELQDACLGTGTAGIPDPVGKISRACSIGARAIANVLSICTASGVDLSAAFRGSTEILGEGFSQFQLGDFLRARAACDVCRALNAADGLSRDCDSMDNALADSSCGAALEPALHVTVGTSQRVYALGKTVVGTVDIETNFAIDGTLTISLFDAAVAQAPENAIQSQTVAVSLAAGGSTQVPVELTTLAEGSYTLVASLPAQHLVGEGFTSFGVRPPRLAVLPQTVLHAETRHMNVPGIAELLASGAVSGTPVTLSLGDETITARVESADPFQEYQGDPLPDVLQNARIYTGYACRDDGTCGGSEQDASVFIIASIEGTDDSMFAMVSMKPDDVLWVEPWADYDGSANLTEHVLYHSSDVLPYEHASDHTHLAVGTLGAPFPRFNLGADAFPTDCPLGKRIVKTLRLNIYEDRVSTDPRVQSLRTGQRMLSVLGWRELARNQFVDIVPRATFARLTVDDVWIMGWKIIPGYAGRIGAVQNAFISEFSTAAGSTDVLFNRPPPEPQEYIGVADTATPIYRPRCSLFDEYGPAERLITLMHELGHTMDWHVDLIAESHPTHLPPMSELWESSDGQTLCTIMHAGYDPPCTPVLEYSRENKFAVTHMAEGICRNTSLVPIGACSVPTEVPARGGTFTGTTSGFSTVDGCAHTNTAPEHVFRWTPDYSGMATFDTCGSNFDTVLYLQHRCGLAGNNGGCNDDSCGTGSRLVDYVTAGLTYYLVVDGYDGASGDFTFRITPPDQCRDPFLLPAKGGSFFGRTSGPSTLSGSGSCRGGAQTPEQVYQWTPAVSGTAVIETCGSNFDASVYVRAGSCQSGAQIACEENGCGLGSRAVSVTAGQTYFIVVDGAWAGESGSYTLTVTPPDSACFAPVPVPPAGGTFSGTTAGASTLGRCGGETAPERVFEWTPALSGKASIKTCGSSYDTVLSVTSGSCTSGTQVACNRDTQLCAPASGVTPNVVAGRTYFITVDGAPNASGAFTLTVDPASPPGNSKLAFITSTAYAGDVGGLAGADALCASRAGASGLPGTYKAWLSDSTTSASSRLTHATVPYRLVDGTILANDWNDLTDGALNAFFALTEYGSEVELLGFAWTGTDPNGSAASAGTFCNDWSSVLPGDTAQIGSPRYITAKWDSEWTQYSGPFLDEHCNVPKHLYCLEQ